MSVDFDIRLKMKEFKTIAFTFLVLLLISYTYIIILQTDRNKEFKTIVVTKN